MASRRFDSILLGGTMLFSGLAKHGATTNRRVEEFTEGLAGRRPSPPPARPAAAPTARPAAARPATPPQPSRPAPAGRAAAAAAAVPAETPRRRTRPLSKSIPSMPMPTGYGLQVRGPAGEEILVPVCLPAGFELDSMMLCPEFLPKPSSARPAPAAQAPRPATAPAAKPPAQTPRPAAAQRPAQPPRTAPAPAAAPAPVADAARMGGTMHYVFGLAESFQVETDSPDGQLAYGIALGDDAEPSPTAGERGLETHRL